jgi:hypothetical protein
LATEFRSKKISTEETLNGFRYSAEERAHSVSEAFGSLRKSQFRGSERKKMAKKLVLQKNPAPTNRIDSVFLSETCFGTEFQEFTSIFVPWYRNPSILLLCGMVRNRIPRVFCCAEQPEFPQKKPIASSILSSAE